MTTPFRSWWYADAVRRAPPPPPTALEGDISADVCIVGAGYTGLWTAIELKRRQRELDIVVVERDRVGSGASGRNGGCLLTWSARYATLERLFGRDEALRLTRASENAVYAIRDFCQAHAIDAEVRIDGALYAASNASQSGHMDGVMAALSNRDACSWRALSDAQTARHSGSAQLSNGVFSPAAGSVHPGLLVLGLARVARAMGVRIFEESPMTRLRRGQPPRVETTQGAVTARRVVLATNAWSAALIPELARSIAIVSSDMVMTEPCRTQLAAIGLNHGSAVCDARIFVHYWRTTRDGRLMLGKGGNTFAFGGRIDGRFDGASRYQPQLTHALARFFPSLADVPVAASWNGPSDRSITGLPFFGHLMDHPAIVYGLGYSGNGVGPSWMGGQILASLVQDRDDAWTRSGLCRGPRGVFPPEPARWLGSMAVRNAIRRKEAMEDRGATPWWLDRQLAHLAAAAGKADKV
ncbi:FAD-dependent oxidoreductase [Chitinibacteraceae bacterium HSL-7]